MMKNDRRLLVSEGVSGGQCHTQTHRSNQRNDDETHFLRRLKGGDKRE